MLNHSKIFAALGMRPRLNKNSYYLMGGRGPFDLANVRYHLVLELETFLEVNCRCLCLWLGLVVWIDNDAGN